MHISIHHGGIMKIAETIIPQRQISRRGRASEPEQGFAGPGHTAITVVASDAIHVTDPFVLLMDDTLDFRKGQQVGEEHPHAGLETLTLMLEGSLDDAAEGLLQEGDLAWMTAGRGVIHNESVHATGTARILQLWVALPSGERMANPDMQVISLDSVPVRHEAGVQARIYGGSSGTLSSPTRTRVPMTVVVFTLAASTTVRQELPGAYRALLYVLDGALRVGDEVLSSGDVCWFDPVPNRVTNIELVAVETGARVILYAGRPLDEPLLQYGPFVAGSKQELVQYFNAFQSGAFTRVSQLVEQLHTSAQSPFSYR
jgi:redox-sensitive bicupin YhaK (pirin superfamily)